MSHNAFGIEVGLVGVSLLCHGAAEVLAKIPSAASIWTIQLGFGAAGLLTWPRRPIIGLFILALAVGHFLWVESFLNERDVVNCVMRDVGFAYLVQGPRALLACLAMHAAGVVPWLRRRHHAAPKPMQARTRTPDRAIRDGFVIGGMSLLSSAASIWHHSNTTGVNLLLFGAALVVATGAGFFAFRHGFSAGRSFLLASLPWVLLDALRIHVVVQHDLDTRMWTASTMDEFFGSIGLVVKGLFFGTLGYVVARLSGVRGYTT